MTFKDLIFSATGKVLATELPKIGNKTTILYPASAKASNEIGTWNVFAALKKQHSLFYIIT